VSQPVTLQTRWLRTRRGRRDEEPVGAVAFTNKESRIEVI
jgi:hypothetical protein